MRPVTLVDLPRLRHVGGHAWIGTLPGGLPAGDSPADQHASGARLFEDGREIGPAHARHADIARLGEGRFSHWGGQIYVSASDNGWGWRSRRRYTLVFPPAADDPTVRVLLDAAASLPGPEAVSERYGLAERIFRTLVPGQHVAETGRWFFTDPDYAAFYERFGEGNYRSYDRRYTLAQFARLAARLPGDFAECGVYRGATAFLLGRALDEAPAERRVHLFDSFAGLSAPEAIDGAYWQSGDMAVGLDEVRTALADILPRIEFHSGWIPERFADVADRRFAIVHLDVDLHQPTADAVAFFYERLVDRGILVCDDYGFDTCPGARRAFDEFFADKPEPVLNLPTGQGIVIRLRG